jgi:dephospho-CoA kinase
MVLEELLQSESRATTRKDLQVFGERVHRKHGQRWLGRKLKASLPAIGNIVIDGIRFPDDHAFLAEAFGPAFRHVHVDAAPEFRARRFTRREGRGNSFAQAAGHPVEAQIPALRELAHTMIANEGRLADLETQLTDLLPAEAIEA